MKNTSNESLCKSIGKVYQYRIPSRGEALLQTVVRFVYPIYCPVCGALKRMHQPPICAECLRSLPRFYDAIHNGRERLNGSKLLVQHFYSMFLFSKNVNTRRVIHQIKYHGRTDLALYLGRLLADHWSLQAKEIDFLVPVPLHPKRAMQRGYNQSEWIARGVSQQTGIPVVANALKREGKASSQTTKSRSERMVSIEKAFWGKAQCFPIGSHILLIDDIITTGATLQAAIDALAQTGCATVSVLSLAVDV